MRVDELDYDGDLFGYSCKSVPYEYEGKVYERTLVGLYLEDDGWWHEKMTFDYGWSGDLLRLATDLVLRRGA